MRNERVFMCDFRKKYFNLKKEYGDFRNQSEKEMKRQKNEYEGRIADLEKKLRESRKSKAKREYHKVREFEDGQKAIIDAGTGEPLFCHACFGRVKQPKIEHKLTKTIAGKECGEDYDVYRCPVCDCSITVPIR